jgi:cation diffusion facilitator CzcD-associated flavoprotein CzcO
MNEVASSEESTDRRVSRRRVAIVGSGPGGLVAARYLKHHGFEPVVFEQDDDIGGAVERSLSSQWRLAFDGDQHEPVANLLQ